MMLARRELIGRPEWSPLVTYSSRLVTGERDLARLLRTMDPVIVPGKFVFVEGSNEIRSAALATVQEPEGLSCVVRREDADTCGLAYEFVAAWITLTVHSALDAVGLTAAVSGVLATNGISCNVIAGLHHDHLLVPFDRANEAIDLLHTLRSEPRN